ncbi:MAG: DUF4932 domain-containing protein [bacterium]|nr:DUF4932 domain-containing protein [bacterium]
MPHSRCTRHLLPLVMACLLAASAPAATAPVSVAVDERVELMSIIARLAGDEVYNAPNSASPYAERVERHFGAFRGHAVVAAYRSMQEQYGVGYDAIPSLAVHLGGVPTLAERIPFDQGPPRLDPRWSVEPTRAFLSALRDFAVASDARGFFDSERDFYAACAARFAPGLSEARAVEWFDAFLGVKAGATYKVIPGLLCGGNNYGTGVSFPDGCPEEVLPVLGCAVWDAGGLPVFTPDAVSIYVHELCHTYTNPVVDRHLAAFEPGASALFPLVADQMSRMAYSTWRIMTCETLVRACVVRYFADSQSTGAALRESAQQGALGFTWVPAVAVSLERFAAARDRYPTLDDFVPEIAKVMEGYADLLAAQLKAMERARPRIVSMVPANGAVDVDPALTTLVIRFDRLMRGQYTFMGVPADIPAAVGAPHWDDSQMSLSVDVQLTPGHTYHYWLNQGQNLGFRAADGTPLTPVEVRFTVADR